MERMTGMMLRSFSLFKVMVVATVMAFASPAWAADQPREIAWPDLIPPSSEPVMPDDLVFGDDTLEDDQTQADQTYDPDLGGVVQHGMTPAPDLAETTNVVEELNDVQVRIAGYVLPLDFENTTVKEFLLVPYVGACIHVPPPPPNQIIYVTSEEGVEVTGMYAPVWATGTLKAHEMSSELADVGYTMTLDRTEPYEY
ncbi:MAG: DUF3299 domain-containing protein [Rhizobiales bacterium]|nr:DUF3299 domain-containing protein [Hyphomicrobiales bacterium]